VTDTPPTAPAGKCPICGKPTDTHYRPFCSRHCADVDLGRWFNERYTVPTDEPAGEGEPGRTGGRDTDRDED
jgi:endogenous inhibitor of DNA gyrase (YacG/DUF329 family)